MQLTTNIYWYKCIYNNILLDVLSLVPKKIWDGKEKIRIFSFTAGIYLHPTSEQPQRFAHSAAELKTWPWPEVLPQHWQGGGLKTGLRRWDFHGFFKKSTDRFFWMEDEKNSRIV